ncbi:MAG TPA: hypothetical protein DHU96_07955 [Actinobacteria bacterium]|nr:hypothetical protein [Actinomycetota bacterium]
MQHSAFFLDSEYPAHGHRLKGDPPGPSLRDGFATHDPVTAHLVFGTEEEGDGPETTQRT